MNIHLIYNDNGKILGVSTTPIIIEGKDSVEVHCDYPEIFEELDKFSIENGSLIKDENYVAPEPKPEPTETEVLKQQVADLTALVQQLAKKVETL